MLNKADDNRYRLANRPRCDDGDVDRNADR
mgnify:CR=1 FL=1